MKQLVISIAAMMIIGTVAAQTAGPMEYAVVRFDEASYRGSIQYAQGKAEPIKAVDEEGEARRLDLGVVLARIEGLQAEGWEVKDMEFSAGRERTDDVAYFSWFLSRVKR